MQVRIPAWIISFVFVNFFSVRFYILFFLFKSDFYPFACFSLFSLRSFFNFAKFFFFFFIINGGPVCPSEVVAW